MKYNLSQRLYAPVWVVSMGCSPLWAKVHARKPVPGWTPFHGATAPTKGLLLCGLFTACKLPSVHVLLLQCCILHGLQERTSWFTMIFSLSCRENLCSSALNITSPSFLTDIDWCLCDFHLHFYHSLLLQLVQGFFFFFFFYHFINCTTRVLVALLIGSALALTSSWSVVELGGTSCVQHRGQLLIPSQRLQRLLLRKSCYINPIHEVNWYWLALAFYALGKY